MIFPLLLLLLLTASSLVSAYDNGFSFIFNDSQLVGVREIQPNGQTLIIRTNEPLMPGVSHTFYSRPFLFKNTNYSSFSTSFVFAIVPDSSLYTFHGMTFAIAPSKALINSSSSEHLGLFNRTNDGNASNHVVAIEFDTFRNLELSDIDSNHVGLDINSVVSLFSTTAGYYQNKDFRKLTLSSSELIRAWVEYDGVNKQLNVTLAPLHVLKPKEPLFSLQIDLSPFLLDEMFVGFTSATGILVQRFYVVAWSFQMNGKAQEFDVSKIPSLPIEKNKTKQKQTILAVGLCLGGILVTSTPLALWVVFVYRRRERKFEEVLESWEVQYGPHRFLYKDLYKATQGFKESELLGKGGFGKVYKGTLAELGTQVAVKKVWHESGRGLKEFVAEIATIGRLRHPNLVRLLGYCRHKAELFLVYDYMPNSSLDGLLFNSKPDFVLSWKQRIKIVIDVAEALAYLHEQWVEVIIHRDVKASNVLLDAELNAKLGDFGLARFSNNGKEAKTTRLAGTLGYIAPELARKGKATTSTDVFAFGAFCLEVVCGRRPVETQAPQEEVILVEWVLDCWSKEELVKAVDSRLQKELDVEEMGLVLKIGLLCSHRVARVRPSMSQVLKFLKRMEPLPEDFDGVLDIREDYLGRVSDVLGSAYFSQIEPITNSITNFGR